MLAVVAVPVHCLHSGVCFPTGVGAFLGFTDAFQRQSVSQAILDIMCIPPAVSFDLAFSILEENTKWKPSRIVQFQPYKRNQEDPP